MRRRGIHHTRERCTNEHTAWKGKARTHATSVPAIWASCLSPGILTDERSGECLRSRECPAMLEVTDFAPPSPF